MLLSFEQIAFIQEASNKALATTGPHGVNVVPVSVLTVEKDTIFLYNFFMNKTADNVMAMPTVSLACWQGLKGLQIKGTVIYLTSGPVFELATKDMTERFPNRTLHGVLSIIPTAVFDVSVP